MVDLTAGICRQQNVRLSRVISRHYYFMRVHVQSSAELLLLTVRSCSTTFFEIRESLKRPFTAPCFPCTSIPRAIFTL
jgi:hypothetical protein